MRFQIDQESRLLNWLATNQPNFGIVHANIIADDTILIGTQPDTRLAEQLKVLPLTRGREHLKNLVSKGEICFVDSSQRPNAAEFGDLPNGHYGEILESTTPDYRHLREKLRSGTSSKEDRDSTFQRLLGHIFKVSKVIELVDRYVAWSLVERGLGENKSNLYWLSQILASGADQLTVYMADPTLRFLKSNRGFRSSSHEKPSYANQLTDDELLDAALQFLRSEIRNHKFMGKFDLKVSSKMPHDRQIRFGLAGKGNLFFKLTAGADMFESDPIVGSYTVSPLSKMDWYNLMEGPEWPRLQARGERFQLVSGFATGDSTTLRAYRHREEERTWRT